MVNGLLASPITCFVEACLDCFESSCGHTGFDWILQLALVYIYQQNQLYQFFFGPEDDQSMGLIWPTTALGFRFSKDLK